MHYGRKRKQSHARKASESYVIRQNLTIGQSKNGQQISNKLVSSQSTTGKEYTTGKEMMVAASSELHRGHVLIIICYLFNMADALTLTRNISA